MAYNFVVASSQYLSVNSAPVTDNPATLVARIRNSDLSNTVDRAIVAIYGPTDTSDAIRLQVDDTANRVAAGIRVGTFVYAYSPTTLVVNTWQHGTALFTSSTSRTAYLDGTAGTAETTSRTPTGLSRLFIGGRPQAGVISRFFAGDMAEVGIWSAALTDAEINSLSKGFKAHRVRPQSLVFYAPLVRNLVDLKNAVAITNNNTATVSNHPRVY